VITTAYLYCTMNDSGARGLKQCPVAVRYVHLSLIRRNYFGAGLQVTEEREYGRNDMTKWGGLESSGRFSPVAKFDRVQKHLYSIYWTADAGKLPFEAPFRSTEEPAVLWAIRIRPA
jgi:hypothetical protein